MKENEQLAERYETKMFHRGIMHFDDVNYNAYNEYILIDPERSDFDENAINSGPSVHEKVSKQGKSEIWNDGQSVHLTEKQLEKLAVEDFQHEELNTLTPEEYEKKRKEKMFEEYKRQRE